MSALLEPDASSSGTETGGNNRRFQDDLIQSPYTNFADFCFSYILTK